MDTERPRNSELFICFTSRLSSSSSSMKISSKSSILSPNRTDKFRETTQISLSSSLSRRLRSNGSLKGGQSPMFPTGNRKKGCAFENPEPSSPKVTCIGQVRVKTKKQGKKIRSRSKRSRGGEVSFRKRTEQIAHQNQQQECLPHRNQRWVHLPLTICEALRAFGAEFNCFLSCKTSCSSSSNSSVREGKEERSSASNNQYGASSSSSCGAVFARWLVALGDGEKSREIELVVGGEEEEEQMGERERHVIEERFGVVKSDIVEEEGEEARVSICIPPKNALLLMRCRSDPVKMAALANRFWESPVTKAVQDDDDDDEVEDEDEDEDEEDEEDDDTTDEDDDGDGVAVAEEECEKEDEEAEEEENVEFAKTEVTDCLLDEKLREEGEEGGNYVSDDVEKEEEENPEVESSIEADKQETAAENVERDPEVKEEANQEQQLEEEEQAEEELQNCTTLEESSGIICSLVENISDKEKLVEDGRKNREDCELTRESKDSVADAVSEPETQEALEEEKDKSNSKQETHEEEEKKEEEGSLTQQLQTESSTSEEEGEREKSEERENVEVEVERESSTSSSTSKLSPDCLLLMMCEPKLSMEVSKETWVCSTDFIRWLPDRSSSSVNPKDGGDDTKKRISTDSNPPQLHHNTTNNHQSHSQNQSAQVPAQLQLQQPPRSSCSFPAAPPNMATLIEQKLVNAVAYEPFVLTRCKSEPMRSSAKLTPEACFWKNRRLEPHRQTTLGVGAAGIGF
ncbi:hypothetical protein RJ641_034368 [Dillenia turbinata]|uniref:Uncharacterized protein n=1 Tax=Dillenia turbinata TaxID=194707 RepID=A0AAN8VUC2_9MAGN